MDIQTRKIEFVQEFLKIQSEDIISRLENVLKSSPGEFDYLSIAEFNNRIDTAMDDSVNDRGINSEILLNEIEQWE